MRYHVTLDFKRGPSFRGEVEADDEAEAKQAAHREAQNKGLLHPVKTATARVVDATEQSVEGS
jgi:hypothetical protein